jgi:signal transduction histidine kinase
MQDQTQERAQERTQVHRSEWAENISTKAQNAMDNSGGAFEGLRENFGEVFRHELNNPLTGILGNAELLLAEIHRNRDGQLPAGGLQRLETIAALAVRLRETIRRLSQEWDVQPVAPRRKVEQ